MKETERFVKIFNHFSYFIEKNYYMWQKSEKKYLETIAKLKEIGESLPPPPGQN